MKRNRVASLIGMIGIILLTCASASRVSAATDRKTNPPAFTPFRTLFAAAIGNSEELNVVRSEVRLAELKTALAETGYFPTVLGEAIDSTGAAGSTGAMGISGLMGSSYRSGWGYGVVATQTLFDFGKTSRSVSAARKDFEAQKSQTDITRNEVAQATLDTYLQCATDLSLQQNWLEIKKLSNLTEKEVSRYVKTGQRSVIERLLARAQLDEAVRAVDSLASRISVLQKRLAVMTGLKKSSIHCPLVSQIDEKMFERSSSATNPFMRRAMLQKDAADIHVDEAKAGYFPKLVAIGSFGDVEDTRVVTKQNYSLGIGLVIPIFDADRTATEVSQARTIAEEKGHEVKAVQQKIDETNLRYDEVIQSTTVELSHLDSELKDVALAVSEARERYFTMHGNLADLREAVRNLTGTETAAARAQSNLLRAKGFKAIYNGEL